MITREEYIRLAKEAGKSEQTINSVLAKKQFKSYSQPLEATINDKTGVFDIPVVGGLLRNVVSSGESYGRMVGGAGYEAQRVARSALGDKNVYVNQETGETQQNPFLNEQELQKMSSSPMEGLGRTANAALTASMLYNPAGLVRGGVKTAGVIRHPIKVAGKELAETQVGRGAVPEVLLKKGFGTVSKPQAELYKGLVPASGKATAKRVIGREIATQGRGAPISYSQILDWQKGARAAGKVEKGKLATPEQQIFQRIGSAYSEILKTGSLKTTTLKKVISTLKGTEEAKRKMFRLITSGVGFGIGGAIGGAIASLILLKFMQDNQ